MIGKVGSREILEPSASRSRHEGAGETSEVEHSCVRVAVLLQRVDDRSVSARRGGDPMSIKNLRTFTQHRHISRRPN